MRPIDMTDDEHRDMLYQIIAGAGPEGISTEEVEKIVQRLHRMRVDGLLVEMFDEGRLDVRWQAEDLTFHAKP